MTLQSTSLYKLSKHPYAKYLPFLTGSIFWLGLLYSTHLTVKYCLNQFNVYLPFASHNLHHNPAKLIIQTSTSVTSWLILIIFTMVGEILNLKSFERPQIYGVLACISLLVLGGGGNF